MSNDALLWLLHQKELPDAIQISTGVGDHVHSIIRKYFGEEASAGCGCGSVIAEMNQLGLAGVRENIDKYVDHLMKQADEKGWWKLIWQMDKTQVVVEAIANLSFTPRAFVTRMVLDAIEQAEKEEEEERKPKPPELEPVADNAPPVDVVYALGPESVWRNNELRYSLRSLEKYALDLGRVFIVGDKPEWLTGVIHIPMKDSHAHNKDANIIDKVRAAIAAGCSERFIFASDDQCLLNPVRLASLPAYYSGDLVGKDSWADGSWWRRMKATRDYIVGRNLPAKNFDAHVFQPHSAKEFERIASEAPYQDGDGFCINTLILNSCPSIPQRPLDSVKLSCDSKDGSLERIKAECANAYRIHLGYNDTGLKHGVKQFLIEQFPDMSRFETEDDSAKSRMSGAKRGIVTLAGGPVYATNAYINCRMLRNMGCTLPIEWCYLGAELSLAWIELIERTIPNVQLIDLGGTKLNNRKKGGGWQAKVEAVLQSEFDELLFLDADSFPLRDPTPLFDHRLFQEFDCILWPDIHTFNADQQAIIQEKHGVEVNGRQIESGQMMFRKEACITGLEKTRAINRNWREVYRYLHGDKDTFLIGALQAGVNYMVNPHVVQRCCKRKHLMQMDLDGKRMFCHLTGKKWELNSPAILSESDYPHYKAARRIFDGLRLTDAALTAATLKEGNMRVRDSICAVEAARIINDDLYTIRPMVGHKHPVRYIVDIGGNAGAFTVAAAIAYPDSEIIVVEPDPELMEDIRFNTRNFAAKIHYVEKACVGVPRDTVSFLRVAANRGGGFARIGDWEKEREATTAVATEDIEITVPAVTLPDLLTEYGFPSIDILKIDAEGAEGEIFASLKKTDWLSKVHWIRGEWHGAANQRLIKEALKATHACSLEPAPTNGAMIAHNLTDV